jgi:hypothetical protein
MVGKKVWYKGTTGGAHQSFFLPFPSLNLAPLVYPFQATPSSSFNLTPPIVKLTKVSSLLLYPPAPLLSSIRFFCYLPRNFGELLQ